MPRFFAARLLCIVFLLAFILCSIWSCEKDVREPDVRRCSGLQINVALKLGVDESSMPQITPMDPTPEHIAATRSQKPTNGEKTINNLNFFFVRKGLNAPVRHLYLQTVDIELDPQTGLFKDIVLEKMYVGKYKMYVIANRGEMKPADEKGFTAQEVDTIEIKNNNSSSAALLAAGLPMTCVKDIEILLVDGEPMPIVAQLEFAVAKINFTCNIFTDLQLDVVFRSIQLCNSATAVRAFHDSDGSGGSGGSGGYGNYTRYEFPLDNNNVEYSNTYYVLKNCLGDVETITSEQERTYLNAPKNSTYIELELEQKSTTAMLSFYLFLGGNMTKNFDTNPNTIYDLNVNIKEIDPETDSRISSLTIDVSGWMDILKPGVQNWQKLTFKCHNLNGQTFHMSSTHKKLPSEFFGETDVYVIDMKREENGASLGNGPVDNTTVLTIKNLFTVPMDVASYEETFFYYYLQKRTPIEEDKTSEMRVHIQKPNGRYVDKILQYTSI